MFLCLPTVDLWQQATIVSWCFNPVNHIGPTDHRATSGPRDHIWTNGPQDRIDFEPRQPYWAISRANGSQHRMDFGCGCFEPRQPHRAISRANGPQRRMTSDVAQHKNIRKSNA